MNHAYYGVYGKYMYSYTVATRLILSHWKFAIDKPLLVYIYMHGYGYA